MINLPENINIDMRGLSHSNTLSELWEDETEAFIYGLYNPRVLKYIENTNLRKKNYPLYSSFTSIMRDTKNSYMEEMQKLMDGYINDGEESPIGLVNHVLENLKYETEEDKLKVAYALGNYVRFNLVH